MNVGERGGGKRRYIPISELEREVSSHVQLQPFYYREKSPAPPFEWTDLAAVMKTAVRINITTPLPTIKAISSRHLTY
jgi:hypothetical protein